MLLDMVKTIAANKKTILLVIVMTGIVGIVGLEILIACSMDLYWYTITEKDDVVLRKYIW